MKFVLEVRMVEESDLSAEAPFLPENEEYEMYLNALSEELARIDPISAVARSSSSFELVTKRSLLAEDLRTIIKPAFAGSIFETLRFVSLVAA